MTPAAILGPNAGWKDLEPFARASGVILQATIPPPDAQAVLIFGGDGTVHRHLPTLVENRIPTLIVPVGSGNDFARAIGIRSRQDAFAAWANFVAGVGVVRSIDVGTITPIEPLKIGPRSSEHHVLGKVIPFRRPGKASEAGPQHVFCCVGGVGLDAAANKRANNMSQWMRGRKGYVIAALQETARWRPVHIRVEFPDAARVLEGEATLVAFGNAPEYGGGMRVAPKARLDDGLLDLCFVRRASRSKILRFFPTVFSGAHLRLPEVEYMQVERFTIHTEHSMDVYADGEFICTTPIEVGVRRQAMQVIVPPR